MDWIAILDAALVGAITAGLVGLLGGLLSLLLPQRLRKGFGKAVTALAVVSALVATQVMDISILSDKSNSGGLFGPVGQNNAADA